MSDALIRFFNQYQFEIMAAEAALGLLLLAFLLLAFSRLARLNRRYGRLVRSASGASLEETLHDYMNAVQQTEDKVAALDSQVAGLEGTMKACVQRIGLVRFDAFEDVGGQQSFALVMLDGERNGIALSSVYSRMDARIYAKELRAGKGSQSLTAEEQSAMTAADSH